MVEIKASSTISFQPTFRRWGFSKELSESTKSSILISPDYTGIIPAMDRRRMSDILKMSIACSLDCMEQAGIKQPDAIVIGTAMGSCNHTHSFLEKINMSSEGLIPPTSFILSPHNTVAGQISLLLKNHNYNMTHTQSSLSFEHALIDAMICVHDGLKNVLVGGVDESEQSLFNMAARLGIETVETSYGSSFFFLSSTSNSRSSVQLIDVDCHVQIGGIKNHVIAFLERNHKRPEDIDLVLYSNSKQRTQEELTKLFDIQKLLDFGRLCGTWFTHSAFAMAYGVDVLSQRYFPLLEKRVRSILICNNLIFENLGLILIENRETDQ